MTQQLDRPQPLEAKGNLGVSKGEAEISPLQSMADDAAVSIRQWRSEAAKQWPAGRRTVNPKALAGVMSGAAERGLEPRLLLYIVLGTEWMLRARLATREDVETQLLEMENRLCSSRYPVFDRAQAFLLIRAVEGALARVLRKRRFLLSTGEWALPVPRWHMVDGNLVARPRRERIRSLVRRKQGPIPRLGPIVAAAVTDGLIGQDPRKDIDETLGLGLTRTLLRRKVTLPEYCRWFEKLKDAPPDPEMASREANTPHNLCDALRQRWKQSYEIAMSRGGWDLFRRDVSRDPKAVFEFAANPTVIATLYSIDWG